MSTANAFPRVADLQDTPWLFWSYVLGNGGMAAAFLAIAWILGRFVHRRQDLGQFGVTFQLFAALSFLTGITHGFRALAGFQSFPIAIGLLLDATCIMALVTAYNAKPMVLKALAMQSPSDLILQNQKLEAATTALRDDRERAYAGFRGSPIPMHTMGTDGTIFDVSDRWLLLLGYTRDEAEDLVIGRPWISHHHNSRGNLAEIDVAHLRAGGEVQDRPRVLVRRDGSQVPVEISKRLERSEDGKEYIVCVVVDVTTKKAAEEALLMAEQRLVHASKMEAIGQITGGVSHDFNNLLQAISGNLRLMKSRMDRGEVDVDRLIRQASNAITACDHAARLTSQLLAFARRMPLNPSRFDPVQVLEEMRALIETTVGPKITLEWNVGSDGSTCFADPTQLGNAILNLVANARDAVLENPLPKIAITIRRQWLTEIGNDIPSPGEYLRIAVCDNGVGMPPEVMARAFEPFFTTKDVGKGTGLGLASVHGFCRQSGGTVSIDSEIGKGSEVAILLPRHTASMVAADPATTPASMPNGQGECLLVVEDVQAVREVLAEQLEDLGYRILQAETADEAVDVLMMKHTSIDAVLTDMMMPGRLDGLELCGLIRAKWPMIPVALMTGNLDAQRNVRLPPGTKFLAKPYKMGDLAYMVEDMLSKKPANA